MTKISQKSGGKILITGGAGFIGSNFVRHIVDRENYGPITVLDKLTYAGNLDNIADLLDTKAVKFIQGDIADKKFINNLFHREKFDTVVNFAAETHVDRSILEPAVFVMTNIVGTHNLLEAAKENSVRRFHQISTDEVYGDLGDNSTSYFTEETPLDPNCPYAASKAAADLLVSSYALTYGMHATISRCSNNYGPYQFPEKLIPYFFQLALLEKPLPLYGDGKNVRDWLYVEDHCEAIALILKRAKPGAIYNIGGHNEKQNIEIARLILKFLGKPKNLLTYVEDRLAHDRRYAMDPTKIKNELGWKPKTSFEDGIRKTFEWYKKNRAWLDKIAKKNRIDETRRHLNISKNAAASFQKTRIFSQKLFRIGNF